MSNFNCDDPTTSITMEEPLAVFWDGNNCKDSRKKEAKPGVYQCGYRNCNNTVFDGWDNTLDGMWVPPNMYVALWDNNRPTRASRGTEIPASDLYEASQSWTEGSDGETVKNLCPLGGYVYDITYAGYGVPNANKTEIIEGYNQLTPHKGIRNMFGTEQFRFENPNDVFGDPVNGKTKTVVVKYKCTKNPDAYFIPDEYDPKGVYGPGYYNNFGDTGAFDDRVGDSYFGRTGRRIGVNEQDTIIIRRNKPWKDHLRDCCFQTKDNPISSQLCGKFDGNTVDGRKACKNFLSECTAEDIKGDDSKAKRKKGKCYDLCQDNPAECDEIKNTFCKDHPEDPFCDCINYQTRPSYKKYVEKYPEIKAYPRTCIEENCNIDDQVGVFKTQQIKEQSKIGCANLNLAKLDITGSHNIIESGGVTQSIKSSGGSNVNTTSGVNNEDISKATLSNNTIDIILNIVGALFGIALIGIIVAFIFGDSKNSAQSGRMPYTGYTGYTGYQQYNPVRVQ